MTSEALVISIVVLWVVVLVLGGVVLALTRQIGVLHERISPVGALLLAGGLKAGEVAPRLQLKTVSGRDIVIGGARDDGRRLLLFFLSPTCPVCKLLLPVIESLRRTESGLSIVLASDGDLQAQHRFIERHGLEAFPYVVAAELGIAYHVGKLPYAVLIDEQGVLRSQGLVNTREHIESILEAGERGVATVQDYLRQTHDGRVGQRDVRTST
jgi:methylamine dehydrogenase accessory protein MauD